MKRSTLALSTTLVLILIAGCTSYGPVAATSNSVPYVGGKTGTACRSWTLHPNLPFAWGRNDIMYAAKSVNIERISVIDSESISYLIYGKQCTVVYGQ